MDNHLDDSMHNATKPCKRPRLSYTPGSSDDVPEDLDLQTARAQNDQRLKSIFEGIFTKYGKDFTEVGDEIDLDTGDVIVNNGHLLGMRGEGDTGDNAQTWRHSDGSSEPGDEDAENEIYDFGEDEDDGFHPPEQPREASPTSNLQKFRDSEFDRPSVDSLWNSAAYTKADQPAIKSSSQVRYASPHVYDYTPKDPLWQVPDLPQAFSTPTSGNRRIESSPRLPWHSLRSTSPPGSGSLWAVPRPRRPRTVGSKPKATPSKRRPKAKRKHHSSPVTRDWSFAKTPDGSESDDPLQEDQPSPTPSKVTNIRGKLGRADYHGSRQPTPVGHTPEEQNSAHIYDDTQASLQCEVSLSTPVQESDPTVNPSKPASTLVLEDTPTKSLGGMTPDEAKLAICLRHVQGKRWGEVLDSLPGRKLANLCVWNAWHWTHRRANPPHLSEPWSQTELDTLAWLDEQSGLSWAEIQGEFPGRSQAEIEFELFRIWVGDEIWNGKKPTASLTQDKTEQEEEQEADTPRASIDLPPVEESPEATPSIVGDEIQPEFEQLVEDDDLVLVTSEVSSPSKLSAIHFDSPAPSRKRSNSPEQPSPAKRVKLSF